MRLILGVTGCSGIIYGQKLLETCKELDIETDLVVSSVAEKIMDFELNKKINHFKKLATRFYPPNKLEAPIASGSVKFDGMVIVPCSMKTLGSIANGISNNLITRTADVCLKEERKLILVPRETPLNSIHLENMKKLKQTGATILPATPAFYHDAQSIDDLVKFIVGKILEQFNIEHDLYQRWSGFEG